MADQRKLIEDLKSDFKGFAVVKPSSQVALLWTLGTLGVLCVLAFVTSPFRAGWVGELAQNPRFSLEVLTGGAAVFSTVWLVLSMSIPGSPVKALKVSSLFFCSSFLALILYSFLVEPSTTVTMAGKRHHCLTEGLAFSALLNLGFLFLVRRRAPQNLALTGVLTGLSSMCITATTMHLACMYSPEHIVKSHIALPLLSSVMVGAVMGVFVLKRI